MKAIIVFALLTHSAWLVHTWHRPVNLDGDAAEYIQLAHNLTTNHVLGFDGTPTSFRPPGYPLFVAVFGSDRLLFIIQALLSIGTAILIYLIGLSINHKVALGAGLCMAAAPMSIAFTTEVMSETLYTFLIVLAIYLWPKAWWAGILFGLSWLVRPTTFPFIVLLLVVGLIRRNHRLLMIVLVAVCVVTPWIIRNAIEFHQFIPITRDGAGLNLLSGTFDIPYGTGNSVWATWRQQPELKTPYVTGDPRNNQMYMERALTKISSDPIGWIRTRVRQYPRLFLDTGSYLPQLPFLKWLFIVGNALLMLLCMCGIYLQGINRFTCFPLFLMLFHLPLWVEPRYSLPIVPFMILLSAIAVQRFALLRSRNPIASVGNRRGDYEQNHDQVTIA